MLYLPISDTPSLGRRTKGFILGRETVWGEKFMFRKKKKPKKKEEKKPC